MRAHAYARLCFLLPIAKVKPQLKVQFFNECLVGTELFTCIRIMPRLDSYGTFCVARCSVIWSISISVCIKWPLSDNGINPLTL